MVVQQTPTHHVLKITANCTTSRSTAFIKLTDSLANGRFCAQPQDKATQRGLTINLITRAYQNS